MAYARCADGRTFRSEGAVANQRLERPCTDLRRVPSSERRNAVERSCTGVVSGIHVISGGVDASKWIKRVSDTRDERKISKSFLAISKTKKILEGYCSCFPLVKSEHMLYIINISFHQVSSLKKARVQRLLTHIVRSKTSSEQGRPFDPPFSRCTPHA